MGFKIGTTVLFDFGGNIGMKGSVVEESYRLPGLHDKFITIKNRETYYPVREKEVRKCKH